MDSKESSRCDSRVVPAERINVAASKRRVGPPNAHMAAEPEITLIRDGDIVRAIEVTCSCGRTIRLKCVY